ncbi:Linear gramicidin dehydrogenase LgrE [Pseudoalteromonas holothuriae]|uniref:Linear gramicidin dehydrogenase LgrE n=1 Tax=Pseudoalteromonas holothuriae TaxID=2963714 RepID=A0A9W4R1K0_9GAMM|nr:MULTISPECIES: thioesterase domain-containing protein [unclassified Pseudoalteromonas]CAH9063966.1 Linear gramicidin dehydrogenase LgrE [Pseudoalteromonas sp. CIP111854]CAH9064488.1 Linear gramicidin dehydrogenase LgrE [Pseudoalteromonas sp. CIP111951]
MSNLPPSQWLYIPKPNPQATLKLICFPYAGGSARSFSDWQNTLPHYVELIMISMPGRGSRFSEPPADCMDILTNTLLDELTPHLNADTIFYGHSLGARVAFEIQLKIKKRGLQGPCHFIASGSANPGKDRSDKNVYLLNDADFIEELKSLNGTPPAVLENEELMALFMPVLRADFKLADTYRYTGPEQLSCNISVFAGKKDEISEQAQLDWQNYFSSNFSFEYFEGDHFFIDSHNEQVGQAVNNIIAQIHNGNLLTQVS